MNIFSYVKSRIAIIDVVNEYTTLKKNGAYWKGHCPFHSERTASFTVTPHKEIFYCFGCHEGGDVVAFITRAEHCSALEAARHIAEKYNIDVPAGIDTLQQTEQQIEYKKRYYALCALVAQYCAIQLQTHQESQDYIASRAITPTMQKQFGLGHFPAGPAAIQQLLHYIKKKHFLAQDLLDTHIILQGKNGLYSHFEDRIIFPIHNHLGNACGFGGRTFHSHDSRAKYYNSHDHTFFNKGSLLFGLDQAKKHMQAKNSAYLVEGYIDCIAMVQAGYANTVATLGTACSAEHLQILSRYVQSLYVVYDGDNAGDKAIIRLSELCWATDMELFIITLPDQEDPASYLGKQLNFSSLIDQAKDIFAWYIDHMKDRFAHKHVSERMAVIRELLLMIQKIYNPIKRDLLLQQAANACSLSVATLKLELENLLRHRQKAPEDARLNKPPVRENTYISSEKKLTLENQIFYAIINNNEFISEEHEKILMGTLPIEFSSIFQKFQGFRMATPHGEFSTFFSTLIPDEQALVSNILMEAPVANNVLTFSKLLDQLRKKQWKIMVNDVKLKLAQTQDDEETKKIIAHFQSLKQKLLEEGLL